MRQLFCHLKRQKTKSYNFILYLKYSKDSQENVLALYFSRIMARAIFFTVCIYILTQDIMCDHMWCVIHQSSLHSLHLLSSVRNTFIN